MAINKLENFKLLTYSMVYASFLLPDSPDSRSVLELDWKHLLHIKRNIMWRIEAWQSGPQRTSSNPEFDEGESSDERNAPPENVDMFLATFGGDW